MTLSDKGRGAKLLLFALLIFPASPQAAQWAFDIVWIPVVKAMEFVTFLASDSVPHKPNLVPVLLRLPLL